MNRFERRVGVGAIVENEGKILLGIRNVDDNRGKWELFGGLIEPNESLEAAIVREVNEEASIRIEPIELVADYGREFPERNLKNIGLCFRCRYVGGEPHQTAFGRVSGFQWATLEDALQMDLTPYTRFQLEQYKAWLDSDQ